MFRRILVPFDDTTCTLRALRIAKDLAKHMHAEVLLVHIEPSYTASPHTLAEVETALVHRAEYLLLQGVHADYAIGVGHREVEIAAIARARQVDLILDVPAHRHQMELEWYARSATQARTEMPAPMLVWPESVSGGELLGDNDAAIVVPVDGCDLAERALPFAIMLAESYQRRIVLVRVVSPQPSQRQTAQAVDEQHAPGTHEAYQYLTALRSRIAEMSDVPVHIQLCVGDPAEEILRVARQQHGGAVVICAHSHGRRERFFLGSVASQLLRRAQAPILIIPPHIVVASTPPSIPVHHIDSEDAPSLGGSNSQDQD